MVFEGSFCPLVVREETSPWFCSGLKNCCTSHQLRLHKGYNDLVVRMESKPSGTKHKYMKTIKLKLWSYTRRSICTVNMQKKLYVFKFIFKS